MKAITLLVLLGINGVAFNEAAFAGTRVRVYCKPDGYIIIEHRLDNEYTEENILEKYPSWITDRNQFPQYEYIEQLRCKGGTLVVDRNYKPEWAIREEKFKDLENQLDSELGKAEPDIITVLRLQREIEKLKK